MGRIEMRYCPICDEETAYSEAVGCLVCGTDRICKECGSPFRSVQGAYYCHDCTSKHSRLEQGSMGDPRRGKVVMQGHHNREKED